MPKRSREPPGVVGHVLVDCIYSSVIEPSRFENLIDSWDSRLRSAGFTPQNLARLNNTEIVEHFKKAQDIAGIVSSSRKDSIVDIAVGRLDTASFVASAAGKILACNAAAASTFGIGAGDEIGNLPLSTEGRAQFVESIGHVIGANDGRHEILRLTSNSFSRPLFAFVRQLRDEGGAAHALIVSTEQVWHKGVEAAMQRAFSFTPAEINVLRMIMSGASVAEISSSLGRLESTIRSQIHSLLSKTGARTQAELMSLTLAFQDSADEDRPAALAAPRKREGRTNPYQTFVLPDGRSLDYLWSGDPNGQAFIWLHGNLAQCRLPRAAENWLADRGLAMVVPIRAGWGYSSPPPSYKDVLGLALADISHLRMYLAIGPCPVIAHCNDFLLACRMAIYQPKLVTSITGIGPSFSVEKSAEYSRVGKWTRFYLANARYAPSVLAYLGRSGYTFARTIGIENFANLILRGTPDVTDLAEPEARRALLAGMEILFGDDARAHDAFAADMIAVQRDPWPDLKQLTVPVTLIHGQQDQNASHQASVVQAKRHGWEMISLPNAGSYLHYRHWQLVLETALRHMPARSVKILQPSTK